jgi:hypothetical protein
MLVPMPREGEEGGRPLVVRVAAGALSAGLAGPDAAVAGAGLVPVIEDVLGQFLDRPTAKRAERVAETLIDAAEELGDDTAEQLKRFVDAAASDETYQELLSRTLTTAQDTAMRDKRRALGRALANALDDIGTKVDDEIAFVRMLADLDPVHIRVLKIMSRRPKHLDRVAWTAPGSLEAVTSGKVGAHGIQEAASRRAAGTGSKHGLRVAGGDRELAWLDRPGRPAARR